jgi:hypothetical protein
MESKKKFALRAEEIQKLVPNQGYCFATDMITVGGHKVGYMYREAPDEERDSGWRFFTGEESQEYVDDPENLNLYDVNTIANYDPEIIPYLNEPVGSAYEREAVGGRFRKAEPPEIVD